MEELKVSYSFDYLKEVFNYILIPVFIVLLIVVVGLVIYAKKEKDHTTEKYNYTMNFWSYLMCIILSAALFAIALSFVVSLHNSIAGRPVDKNNLIYIVYLSPIIPLLFLISTGVHWIKMFLSYKNRRDDDNDEIEENEDLDENENSEETPDTEIENIPIEKDTIPIPVTPDNEQTDSVMDNSESPIPIVVEEPKENTPEDVVEAKEEIDNNIDDNKEEIKEEDSNIEDLEDNKKKESEESEIEVLDID